MSLQTWQETLITAHSDGAAYGTSVTKTSLLPTHALFTLPSNFGIEGKMLRVRASGRISSLASATLLLNIFLGSVNATNWALFTLNATAQTNVTWVFEADLVFRALGSTTTANLLGVGTFTSQAVIGVGVGTFASTQMIPAGSPVVGTGFDSTSSQVVDLQATWGASSASNVMTLHQYALEALN